MTIDKFKDPKYAFDMNLSQFLADGYQYCVTNAVILTLQNIPIPILILLPIFTSDREFNFELYTNIPCFLYCVYNFIGYNYIICKKKRFSRFSVLVSKKNGRMGNIIMLNRIRNRTVIYIYFPMLDR